MEAVILKKGREKIFFQRHHWIFSGAILSFPKNYQDGDLVPVESFDGRSLGWAFFNRRCSLAGRIVSFDDKEVYTSLRTTLGQALELRESLLKDARNTGCRLVNGEGDGIPGLIVDKYGPYLVVQVGALGAHKLLPFFCDFFTENLQISGIYEKSTSGSLKEEGLAPQEQILWGAVPDQVTILEEGIPFVVAIKTGQKTGFFLDQREMRKWVATLARSKRVLNGFCYSGGFTLAALQGGASAVTSVDISSEAIDLCKQNVVANGFSLEKHHFYAKDMFEFLMQDSLDFDLAILDPPAFAKKKKDIPAALKGYRRLFELALKKMPSNSLLLLSSCSYYISDELFEECVMQAALNAKRAVRIIGRHRHALDHPVNLFHPESSYLKSILLAL